MKVLVADDHPVMRRGLIEILEEAFGQVQAGEAGSAPEAIRQIHDQHWDVVVLDLTMPGGGGLEVLNDIASIRPGLPVIVLSMHPEDQYAVRVLKAGAAGYVVKDAAPQELAAAVRKALDGGTYVSDRLAEKLAGSLKKGGPGQAAPHEGLSDREYQVMVMLAEGSTVGQVADELSLSVKTVSTYHTRIMQKMQMHTDAQLARYAVEKGLLTMSKPLRP